MNKVIFAVASLLLVSSSAFAKVGLRNLEEDAKHRQICMPYNATGATSNGLDGVVFQTTVNGVTTPTSTAASAGAPSTFPWPSKLGVIMIDASANGTVACASVVITGTDQFGAPISETVSTVSETVTNTSNVFSTVSSVVGATCTGGADAGDLLVVRQSAVLGLTVKIGSYEDVESACIYDTSTTGSPSCARSNNGGADDLQSAVSASTHTIDVSALELGAEGGSGTIAADDILCLRIRSSKTAR